MPGTYSQIYLQFVFAVRFRESLITPNLKNRLYPYMAAIIKEIGCKPIIINGMPDHVHVFVGFNPKNAISDFVRDLKNNTSKFIFDQKLLPAKFAWQQGYGAFSYAQSQIDAVHKYIEKQEEHHKKQSFKDEYLNFLKAFKIDFEEQYLFDWHE